MSRSTVLTSKSWRRHDAWDRHILSVIVDKITNYLLTTDVSDDLRILHFQKLLHDVVNLSFFLKCWTDLRKFVFRVFLNPFSSAVGYFCLVGKFSPLFAIIDQPINSQRMTHKHHKVYTILLHNLNIKIYNCRRDPLHPKRQLTHNASGLRKTQECSIVLFLTQLCSDFPVQIARLCAPNRKYPSAFCGKPVRLWPVIEKSFICIA
jgi:hypothetical protein